MYILQRLEEKYLIEYDKWHKIIYIRQKISVKDFVAIKELLNASTLEIEDIRVEHN